MPSVANAVPLRGLPSHSRPLLVGHALAVAVLVVLTVATASYGRGRRFADAYYAVLPAVAFGLPVVVGVASAALGGGLVPTLALGGFLAGRAGRLAWYRLAWYRLAD